MPPLRVIGRAARPIEAKRRIRVVRLIHPRAEMMPASIDAGGGAIIHRAGFGGTWPAAIASLDPSADRASRGPLNGFPEAFAEVLRHRVGGGQRRLSDRVAAGLVGRR